jgi:hypothetical protein
VKQVRAQKDQDEREQARHLEADVLEHTVRPSLNSAASFGPPSSEAFITSASLRRARRLQPIVAPL